MEEEETQRQKDIEGAENELEELTKHMTAVNRSLDSKRNEFKLTKDMVDNLEGFPESIKFLKNHKDWAKHMKRLVENPNMIEDLGNRLYETVKDTYSLKKVCKDRVEFFKSIIK